MLCIAWMGLINLFIIVLNVAHYMNGELIHLSLTIGFSKLGEGAVRSSSSVRSHPQVECSPFFGVLYAMFGLNVPIFFLL